jgi:methionyl aminopeptidase
MNITLKTESEIDMIRESSLLVSRTLGMISEEIKPGVITLTLDKLAEQFIQDNGGIPAFKNYKSSPDSDPFPYTLCVSLNEEVVHGFPGKDKILQEGDIVSIDCGVLKNGFYGDSAFTFPVGQITPEKELLLQTTRESLYEGIQKAIAGNRIGDVGYAIQHFVESKGYSVVVEMVGHGVGVKLHEPPEVPNYGKKGQGVLLKEGMVIAIEPMINMGKRHIRQAKDGWTIYTADRNPSAHFEHTIVVRKQKAEVLSSFEFIKEEFCGNTSSLQPQIVDE